MTVGKKFQAKQTIPPLLWKFCLFHRFISYPYVFMLNTNQPLNALHHSVTPTKLHKRSRESRELKAGNEDKMAKENYSETEVLVILTGKEILPEI